MAFLTDVREWDGGSDLGGRRDRTAVVVYESMFGNTQAIAMAITEEIRSTFSVTAFEVGEAPDVIGSETDLLVVGAPTHAFSMSRPSTRHDAAQKSTKTIVSTGRGVREWLGQLRLHGHVAAATFDTKVNHPRLPGSAAVRIERRLRHRGSNIIAPSATFFVEGTDGPLMDGEIDRAKKWAAGLVAATLERTERRT